MIKGDAFKQESKEKIRSIKNINSIKEESKKENLADLIHVNNEENIIKQEIVNDNLANLEERSYNENMNKEKFEKDHLSNSDLSKIKGNNNKEISNFNENQSNINSEIKVDSATDFPAGTNLLGSQNESSALITNNKHTPTFIEEKKNIIMFKDTILKATLDITLKKLIKREEYYFTNYNQIQCSENDNTFLELLTYSNTKLHPLSFSLGQNKFCFKDGKLKNPSPLFIPPQYFCQVPSNYHKKILEGSVIDNKKGLINLDKNVLIRFKGIVSDMIGQILKRIFGGPPVSLNVKIFDTQSSLQRNCEAWAYAPLYLKKAAFEESNIERFKNVISFCVSGLILTFKQLKPFNPLIGETFEGQFADGSKIYAEHIGHYPTLSRFYLKDVNNDYTVHGCFDLDAKTESFGSVIFIIQKGDILIEFPKLNEKFMYRMPIMKLENCKSEEERNCFITDYMEIYDLTNAQKALIKFGYNSKEITKFVGAIFKSTIVEKQINNKVNDKYYKCLSKYLEEKIDSKKTKLMDDHPLPLSIITGSVTENLFFDNNKYWDFNENDPFFVQPCYNVLPSDTRFREDLIWLYYANYYSRNPKEFEKFCKLSQSWKLETELIQRKEREIRADYRKKLNKNN